MIYRNQTWDLVSRSQDRYAIGLKWVFRTKFNCGFINRNSKIRGEMLLLNIWNRLLYARLIRL